MKGFEGLENLCVPRWFLSVTKCSELQLHALSGASEFAYVALVYVLMYDGENKLVSFVIRKSRVTSEKHKHWSVPGMS